MQIKTLLITALRDHSPRQFNQLSRSGELNDWLSTRLKAANDIYDELTLTAERLPNGLVRDPALRQCAEEQAIAAVTDDLI
jgi:hypothetical protein